MSHEHEHEQDPATPGIPDATDATLRGLAAGQLIAGRFRLDYVLGKGGMSVVWEAHDESLGGKARALKFLTETFTQDAVAVAELKEEVARCQELSHPHIIRVHDLVEDRARGLIAVSMEIAGGGSLNARRAARPHRWFEPEELRIWLRQLCTALDYAHLDARIVHRDLKPANLLLDERERLKIADFGIAHAVSESVTRLSGGRGPTSGTPAYMSPQQAIGKRPQASDDVYALGATLYDLLTGKPPYRGAHYSIVLAQLLDPDLLPPSIAARRRDLRDFEAPIPAAWEEIIAACLAKEPEDRPQSAGEVFERLAHWEDRGPRPLRASVDAPRIDLFSHSEPEKKPARSAAVSPVGLGRKSILTPAMGILRKSFASPPFSSLAGRVMPRRAHLRWAAGLGFVCLGVWAGIHLGGAPQTALRATSPLAPLPATPAPLVAENALLRLPIGGKVIADSSFLSFGPPFGFIDATSKIALPLQWNAVADFSDGRARVQRNGKWGFIDVTGKVVIPLECEDAADFSDGLARVQRNGKWGFIDVTGKVVISPQWNAVADFSDGRARVQRNGKWGFIDVTGKVVVPLECEDAADFSEGLASVQRGHKYGFIDRTGKVVIPVQWMDNDDFSGGLAPVKRGGKYGFIDRTGKIVILPQWDDARPFSDGLASVKQVDKYGFIDKAGKVVIKPQWSVAFPFAGGVARVKQGGKYGFIDTTGKVVVPLEWDYANSPRIGKNSPGYHHLMKKTASGKVLAVWLGQDLKEICRVELPLEEEKE